MLTVRFPNGVSVTYNSATQLVYGASVWQLYTEAKEAGGKWVCSIQPSAGVIIEASKPCSVEVPPIVTGTQALEAVIEAMSNGTLADAPSWLLKDLKRGLRNYNARTAAWKP